MFNYNKTPWQAQALDPALLHAYTNAKIAMNFHVVFFLIKSIFILIMQLY